MAFDPSTATPVGPSAAFDPSTAQPADDEPYTATGAGAIPRGPKPATVAPPTDMQARVARMQAKPPGPMDKIIGAVEAGLNAATSMTNFGLGLASGVVRNAATGAGELVAKGVTAADRMSRGVPTSLPGDPSVGDAAVNPMTGPDMQAVTYQPKTDVGQENVEDVVQPAFNALGPAIGHGHEIAHAAPAVAPAVRAAGDVVKPVVAAAGEAAAKGAAKIIGVDPELAKVAQTASSLKYPIDVRPDQVVKNAKFTKLVGQAASDVPLSNSKSASNRDAFTRNVVDLVNPEETAERLTPDVFAKAMDRSGSGIGEIMARTDVPLDAPLRDALDDLRQNVTGKQTADTAKIVNTYIDELHNKAGDDGIIDGTALRTLNSEIGQQARTNAGNDLGAKLNDLQGIIEDATQRHVDPEDAQPLKDFRRQYAYGKILEPTVAKTIDGQVPPSSLMQAVTSTKIGKHLMANAKGGPIGDLAKVGKLVTEPPSSGTAERSLVYGAIKDVGKTAAAAAGGYPAAVAYNTLGPKLTRAMVGKKAAPEVAPRPEPPPEPTTSPGAGGPSGGGDGGSPSPPLGDLTPDWSTTPGAGGGAPRGGHEPGLVRALDETPPTTGSRRDKPQQPLVPGKPGVPDTIVSGPTSEQFLDEKTQAALKDPDVMRGSTLDRPAPKMPEPSPVLTETQRLAAEHESPAVRKAIQEHEAKIKAEDTAKALAVAREHDAQALEKAARDTTDPALQARLLKQADKLRGTEPIPVGKVIEGEPPPEKIPAGKVIEGQPEIKTDKPGKVPVGKATEITPEYIEADRAWRAEHLLNAEDAQRARDVAAALQHDEVGVHRAVRQFETQPRAFDRAIARINEEGEARANESEQPAGGSPGDATPAEGTGPSVRSGEGPAPVRDGANDVDKPVPAASAEAGGNAKPEPLAAVRTPDQQPGADSVRAAGPGGAAAAEPAGGQAPAGAQGASGVEIRETPDGFEAHRDGKKIGYLKDNLERGQAAQLGENANVDMVKVDKAERGKGVGSALYAAFNEKHGGAIMPSGKTEPSAWAVWKRNYPDKVDAFVAQEAQRIKDGADAKLVAGNITDKEVRARVLEASEPEAPAAPQGPSIRSLEERVRTAQKAYDANVDKSVTGGDRNSAMVPPSIRASASRSQQAKVERLQRELDDAKQALKNAYDAQEKTNGTDTQQLQPDAVRPAAAEKGVPKDEPPEEIFRQGQEEKAQPLTSAEDLDSTLRDKFGEKLIDGLLEQGVLKYAKNSDEQPAGVRSGIKAIMRNPAEGQPAATLYYDKLTAEQAPGILMHELGEHFGIVRLLGQERYNVMLNDLRKMKDEPEVREAWDKVSRSYLDPRAKDVGGVSSVEDPRFMREVAAHLVETHPELPFVRRMINEIRAFFYEKFGTTMGNRVDANLIRGLAASALRKASTGELPHMTGRVPPVAYQPFVAPSRAAR